MIKKLRIKFVCVIMVIVMVLLGAILGVVIYFTGQNMEIQSINMMRTIAAAPFQQGSLGKPSKDEVRLPFFTVQISSRGDLIAASGGYFDLTDREYLQEIINAALLSDQETGELGEHDLRYLKSVSPRGFTKNSSCSVSTTWTPGNVSSSPVSAPASATAWCSVRGCSRAR